MAEDERVTEVTDEVRLPDGTTVKEYTNPETGNITYRRTGRGISGAQFISPDVARGLQQTTELGGRIEVPESELTQEELSNYGIGLSAEELRQNRINNKYQYWDEGDDISTNRILGGKEYQDRRWVQGWMENNEVQTMVNNDPLLETKQEKQQAREALAREIVERLKNVQSRDEAKFEVLRDYGIY